MNSNSTKILINESNAEIIALVITYLKIHNQYYDNEGNYWLVYIGNDRELLHISKTHYWFESPTS